MPESVSSHHRDSAVVEPALVQETEGPGPSSTMAQPLAELWES